MHGEEHLKKPEQFKQVYQRGVSWADRLVVVKIIPDRLNFSRYGLSVSQQVGGAVVRNRVKRRLREIVRNTPLKPGWDIVLIARKPSAEADYRQLKQSLEKLFMKAGVLNNKLPTASQEVPNP